MSLWMETVLLNDDEEEVDNEGVLLVLLPKSEVLAAKSEAPLFLLAGR